MDVVGGRLRYWFQNCSVEDGGKEELVEENSEEGEDDAEEGVDDPLETEEARDLSENTTFCFGKTHNLVISCLLYYPKKLDATMHIWH